VFVSRFTTRKKRDESLPEIFEFSQATKPLSPAAAAAASSSATLRRRRRNLFGVDRHVSPLVLKINVTGSLNLLIRDERMPILCSGEERRNPIPLLKIHCLVCAA